MKIRELLTEDDHPFDDRVDNIGWDDLEKFQNMRPLRVYLERRGFKYLKSGENQDTYLSPNGRTVLKTFEGSRFDPVELVRSDEGVPPLNNHQRVIEVYHRFVVNPQNRGNPHLPKNFTWGKFIWRSGKQRDMFALYLWITMETLQDGVLPQPYRVALRRVSAGMLDPREFAELVGGTPSADLQLWFDTLSALYTGGRRFDYIWDASKEENIMFRGDGVPVIVDPWAA